MDILHAIDCLAAVKCEKAPEGFPFKIEDIPGKKTVTLTRELKGETITVEANLIIGEEDQEVPKSDCLPLAVIVSKEGGPYLKFGCSAYAKELIIDSLTIKDPEAPEDQAYEGPDFSELDENMQKDFHKYLEIKGINHSLTKYLFGYMIEKEIKEYKTWLKNVKELVQV